MTTKRTRTKKPTESPSAAPEVLDKEVKETLKVEEIGKLAPGEKLVVQLKEKVPAHVLANTATMIRAEARRAGVAAIVLPYGVDKSGK